MMRRHPERKPRFRARAWDGHRDYFLCAQADRLLAALCAEKRDDGLRGLDAATREHLDVVFPQAHVCVWVCLAAGGQAKCLFCLEAVDVQQGAALPGHARSRGYTVARALLKFGVSQLRVHAVYLHLFVNVLWWEGDEHAARDRRAHETRCQVAQLAFHVFEHIQRKLLCCFPFLCRESRQCALVLRAALDAVQDIVEHVA